MKENILIIDDDVSILAAFEEVLTEYGYAVDTVENEKSALEKINTKKYDIVIVDMVLKETKGLDLISKIQDKFQDIVTIALTGYSPQEYVTHSFRQGAVAFITKPCTREDLVAAICHGLAQRENRKGTQNTTTSFSWEQIIRENPSCVDTILNFAKRKIDKEVFYKVKRCKRNFECLFSEESNVCPGESHVEEVAVFIKKECKKECCNNNQFSFGYAFCCSCPIRGELYKKHKI
ncbi:MAG: response regulator [PVC group bacterium]|nr:response regulator [PVC group bacterium]